MLPVNLHTNKMETVPHHNCDIWFDERAITNIFRFSEMEDKYRITRDIRKGKEFVVHMPHKQVKSKRSPEGL